MICVMLIINIKIDTSMKILLIVALMLVVSLEQNHDPIPQSQDFASIEEQILQQEQLQQKDIQSKLPSFIYDQLKQATGHQQTFKATESFIVSLAQEQQFQFRYKVQSNPNPGLNIKIFTQQSQDDIAFIKDHQIGNYLEVFSSTSLLGTYRSVGKTYMNKIIPLGSHSGAQLFIRLENKFDFAIITQITLSGPPLQVDHFNAVKNSQFSIVAKKLQAIQNEMKEVQAINRNSFKVEWGFLEREQHYQQEMLKLTGFESLIILATSIVQVCCLKSLIDKNVVI